MKRTAILNENISNEWYAKDTSKKIRAVMRAKGNAGEHLSTHAIYGYQKSPDNPKQWVIDEEAAQVVCTIGLLVMDGYGPTQIAKKLTERKILTPSAYFAHKGVGFPSKKQGLPYAWDSATVADIMDRWREYLGHTVNFKTKRKSYKLKKTVYNPPEEWAVFENTHIARANLDEEAFVKQVMDDQQAIRSAEQAKAKRTLAAQEHRIAEIDHIMQKLYEDSVTGKITEER